jgi:hypothetical protein
MENAKIGTIAEAFERVCNVYKTRGFQVTIALMDGQFELLQGKMPTGVLLQIVSKMRSTLD